MPPARLLIRGSGSAHAYRDEIDNLIAMRGLQQSVKFVEPLPTSDLAALMSSARVLVVPSLSEGLSRVTIEAMLTGTPVVASRVGGIPDLVVHGDNGFLVPPGDVDALAAALVQVFERADVDGLGVRARERGRTMSSADAYVAGHVRIVAAARERLRER
jgi:glycosyltransferase involved in cell wall biosynthesis